MTLYYPGNHRFPEQLADMRRLEDEGVCIFCPEHIGQYPAPRVIHDTALWTIAQNVYPYANTKLHYVLAPHEHVTDLLDLPTAALQDFWVALAWVRSHHGLTFYSLVGRNGECEFTGATVRHVHVHVLQGDVDDPAHEPVRTKLSSRPPHAGYLEQR